MIDFKVTKDKKNNLLKVNARVPDNDSDHWWVCEIEQVQKYLEENNIIYGECLKKDYACNHQPKWEAEFIFKLEAKKELDKAPKSVVSSNRAKRTKRSSKPKDE